MEGGIARETSPDSTSFQYRILEMMPTKKMEKTHHLVAVEKLGELFSHNTPAPPSVQIADTYTVTYGMYVSIVTPFRRFS